MQPGSVWGKSLPNFRKAPKRLSHALPAERGRGSTMTTARCVLPMSMYLNQARCNKNSQESFPDRTTELLLKSPSEMTRIAVFMGVPSLL